MGNGFAIPHKIPRKRRDGGDRLVSTGSTSIRSNRKLLPTKARAGESKTPEWDAMSKLLSYFLAREDAGGLRCILTLAYLHGYSLVFSHIDVGDSFTLQTFRFALIRYLIFP